MQSRRFAWGIVFVSFLALSGTTRAQDPALDKAPGAPGAGTLPVMIPIFPLEDAMLFPNASRPLHIFEPRYRAMVADALKGDRVIGMVTLKPGHEADYEGRPPVYAIGCAGVITDVEALPDGRFNIVLRGLVKFRVTGEDQSRSYRIARVSALPEPTTDADKAALHRQRRRLELLLTVPGSSAPPEITDEEVVNTLTQYVPLDPPERQALLEMEGALVRSEALIDRLGSTAVPPR